MSSILFDFEEINKRKIHLKTNISSGTKIINQENIKLIPEQNKSNFVREKINNFVSRLNEKMNNDNRLVFELSNFIDKNKKISLEKEEKNINRLENNKITGNNDQVLQKHLQSKNNNFLKYGKNIEKIKGKILNIKSLKKNVQPSLNELEEENRKNNLKQLMNQLEKQKRRMNTTEIIKKTEKNRIFLTKEVQQEFKNLQNFENEEKIKKEECFYFYISLRIDGNKVLNILRGVIKINKNQNIELQNIVWMYCLTTKFMNDIFKKGIDYFYKIMNDYYTVVEAQMIIYFNNINNNISFIEIISIYNYFVSIEYKYINEIFMKNIDSFKSNIDNNDRIINYNRIKLIMYSFKIKDNENNENININFLFDLDFYIYFYIMNDNIKKTDRITIDYLKKNYFYGNFIYVLKKKKIIRDFHKQLNRDIPVFNNNNKKNENLSKTGIDAIKGKLKYFLNTFKKNKNFDYKEILIVMILLDLGVPFDFIMKVSTCIFGNIFRMRPRTIINENGKDKQLPDTLKIVIEKKNFKARNLYSVVDTNDGKMWGIADSNFNLNFEKNEVSLNLNMSFRNYILRPCIENKIFSVGLSMQNINFYENFLTFFNNIIYGLIENQNINTIKINEKMEECYNHFFNMGYDFYDDFDNKKKMFLGRMFLSNFKDTEMMVISYNEEKKEFNDEDCIGIITKILIKLPSIIVIGTQESGTSLQGITKLFEATHYIHVLGEKLKEIGYKLLEKDRGHSIKLKTENVRLRVYYLDKVVGIGENNDRSIKIIDNKMNTNRISLTSFGKGAVFSELCIRKNNENRNFIFMNADFSYGKNSNNDVKEKFIKLVNKKLFGGNESLVDFYKRKYNIIVFGDLKFDIALERIKSSKVTQSLINSNINTLKNNFSVSLTTQSQILSILPQITSDKIYQIYDNPNKSDKKMASLTFSLYRNNNQSIKKNLSSSRRIENYTGTAAGFPKNKRG